MAIDLKTAIALGTRRYLAPTVVVLLVLSGMLASGMAYVWGEYKDLMKERNQLIADRNSLSDEIVRSTRNRADASIAMIDQKAQIEKREFVLQQLEGQNKEKLSALQQRAAEYEAAFVKLQQAQSSVSQAQRQKEVEDKLQNLMSQFSAMGVDLNVLPRCGDTDGQSHFNAAKAKFTEIYTVAEANGLTKKYSNFIINNNKNVYSECKK